MMSEGRLRKVQLSAVAAIERCNTHLLRQRFFCRWAQHLALTPRDVDGQRGAASSPRPPVRVASSSTSGGGGAAPRSGRAGLSCSSKASTPSTSEASDDIAPTPAVLQSAQTVRSASSSIPPALRSALSSSSLVSAAAASTTSPRDVREMRTTIEAQQRAMAEKDRLIAYLASQRDIAVQACSGAGDARSQIEIAADLQRRCRELETELATARKEASAASAAAAAAVAAGSARDGKREGKPAAASGGRGANASNAAGTTGSGKYQPRLSARSNNAPPGSTPAAEAGDAVSSGPDSSSATTNGAEGPRPRGAAGGSAPLFLAVKLAEPPALSTPESAAKALGHSTTAAAALLKQTHSRAPPAFGRSSDAGLSTTKAGARSDAKGGRHRHSAPDASAATNATPTLAPAPGTIAVAHSDESSAFVRQMVLQRSQRSMMGGPNTASASVAAAVRNSDVSLTTRHSGRVPSTSGDGTNGAATPDNAALLASRRERGAESHKQQQQRHATSTLNQLHSAPSSPPGRIFAASPSGQNGTTVGQTQQQQPLWPSESSSVVPLPELAASASGFVLIRKS